LLAVLLTAVFDLLFDASVWALGKLKKRVDRGRAICNSKT